MRRQLHKVAARRLTKLRTAHDLTPAEMADALGIKVKRYYNFERSYPIPMQVLNLIAERFRVGPDWLYYGWTGNLPPEEHKILK